MKSVLIIGLVLLVSCNRGNEKQLSANVITSHPEIQNFLSIAKGKKMFSKLSQMLDLSTVEQSIGAQNVVIYLVKFKGNANKIYAINTLGSELLYAFVKKDANNGTIGLFKNGEAITIEFKDGVRVIKDISNEQFTARFVSDFHGGPGFCQRQQGESFGDCFRAECDEFCDSFISCVALNTQPIVPIMIGLACSCNA